MNIFNQFNIALDEGLTKTIFDHIRNYLMCALLLAIGTAEFNQHTSQIFSFVPNNYSGTGVIGISCILIFLNLYDGIRKISNSGHHVIFIIGLIFLYMFISVRVVELSWNFRIAL